MKKILLIAISLIVFISCSEQNTPQPKNTPQPNSNSSQVNYNRVRVNFYYDILYQGHNEIELDDFISGVFKVNNDGKPLECFLLTLDEGEIKFSWLYDNSGKLTELIDDDNADTTAFYYSNTGELNLITKYGGSDSITVVNSGNKKYFLDEHGDTLMMVDPTNKIVINEEERFQLELSSQSINCNPVVDACFAIRLVGYTEGEHLSMLINEFFPNHPFPYVFINNDTIVQGEIWDYIRTTSAPSEIEIIRDSQNRIIEIRSMFNGITLATFEYFTQ